MRKKQGQHFADIFEVLEKDPDGKRFDKGAHRKFPFLSCLRRILCRWAVDVTAVSRIRAHSDMYEMDLLLDINADLYPVDVGTAALSVR